MERNECCNVDVRAIETEMDKKVKEKSYVYLNEVYKLLRSFNQKKEEKKCTMQ